MNLKAHTKTFRNQSLYYSKFGASKATPVRTQCMNKLSHLQAMTHDSPIDIHVFAHTSEWAWGITCIHMHAGCCCMQDTA